jgi:hypothetical protein
VNVRVAGTGMMAHTPQASVVQDGIVVPPHSTIDFFHTYSINGVQCDTLTQSFTPHSN